MATRTGVWSESENDIGLISNVSVSVKQHQRPKRSNSAAGNTATPVTAELQASDGSETPVISNRGSPRNNTKLNINTRSNPPPLELSKLHTAKGVHNSYTSVPSSNSNKNKAEISGLSLAEEKSPEAKQRNDKSSSENQSTTGARFSSDSDPPIVLEQWPSGVGSGIQNRQEHAPVPRTISLNTEIRGILNYGQTCFLNCVVQSLASLTAFDLYVNSQLRFARQMRLSCLQYDDNNEDDDSLYLTKHLWRGMQYVNGNKVMTQIFDPRSLLDAVAQSHKQFQSLHQQQDAQELLTALLDVLVQEQESHKVFRPMRKQRHGWLSTLPATPEPEELVFSSYTPPAAVWALSPSFLRLQLAAFPINEDDGDNESDWKSYVIDDDMVSVASSARERAQERWKEKMMALSAASRPNSPMHNQDAAAAAAENNEKVSSTDINNGTATTSSSTSSQSPNIAGDEKKREEFEVHVPGVCSTEYRVVPSNPSITGEKSHVNPERRQTPEIEEETESVSDLSSSVVAQPPMSRSSISQKQSHPTTCRSIQQRPAERLAMPLNGWMGSTLQCRTCHYVRPIKNVPFIDVSIVPTDVTNPYAMSKMGNIRPCTIEECLNEFTRVERVEQVDCPSCTKLHHLNQAREEVDFWEFTLADAAVIQQKKQKQRSSVGDHNELQSIKEELDRHVETLQRWKRIDCDDDNCAEQMEELLGLRDYGEKLTMIRKDANKCLFLTRLPAVLCLHIQRRFYDPQTGRLSKTTQPVLFDEFLDLAPYCAYTCKRSGNGRYQQQTEAAPSWVAGKNTAVKPKGQEVVSHPHQIFYRLAVVLEHQGGANCGHYVCYRRSPSGEWWYVSDHVARRVSWHRVLQCQAYMLFYENNNISELCVN